MNTYFSEDLSERLREVERRLLQFLAQLNWESFRAVGTDLLTAMAIEYCEKTARSVAIDLVNHAVSYNVHW